MSVYDDFFANVTPESWEFFATDFLSSLGFTILQYPSRGADGGKDAIVEYNNISYIVSCKHYIISGKSVGVSDESSIIDRIIQHNVNGFIGFYSTLVSTSLNERLEAIKNNGYETIIYDKNLISDYLPRISSHTLQKYGLPNKVRYVLNVDNSFYRPLPCLNCERDILDKNLISSSMALICLNENSELEYLYGCKQCIGNIPERGWVEINQALHLEQLNGWIDYVNDFLEEYEPSPTFYKHKSEFESGIQQRIYPSNWGQWLAL